MVYDENGNRCNKFYGFNKVFKVTEVRSKIQFLLINGQKLYANLNEQNLQIILN